MYLKRVVNKYPAYNCQWDCYKIFRSGKPIL